MKNITVIALLMLIATGGYSQETAKIKVFCDKNASVISYSMNHPLHAWTGDCRDVTSIILTDANRSTITNVAVSVKISSFDSQNANRDSHVMETTEALTYPAINFTSNSIKQENEKLYVTGILTFHGVSQAISFEAEKKIIQNKAEISGNFVLKMTQFNITPPSLMGLATDDDFKISFRILY